MSKDEDAEQELVGYCNPPLASRFRKGQSGNPKGRPRGRRRELPYDAVLGQEVTIRENGRERRVTAAAAFLLRLIKLGLEGNIAAAAAIAAIGDRRGTDVSIPRWVTVIYVEPGCVNSAVECLRIGTKLDRYRETARMALERRSRPGALCGKATDPRRAGGRAKSDPNTGQGPVARLVGR